MNIPRWTFFFFSFRRRIIYTAFWIVRKRKKIAFNMIASIKLSHVLLSPFLYAFIFCFYIFVFCHYTKWTSFFSAPRKQILFFAFPQPSALSSCFLAKKKHLWKARQEIALSMFMNVKKCFLSICVIWGREERRKWEKGCQGASGATAEVPWTIARPHLHRCNRFSTLFYPSMLIRKNCNKIVCHKQNKKKTWKEEQKEKIK